MSQVTNFDVPSSPLTMSALATALEAIFAALGSINRGATAPSNPFEGMLWWDSAAVVEVLKRYTVTAGWISILSINRTTGAFDLIPATDAATVSTVMKRDSGGRAKVVAPAVAADIALKSTVTADIATHDALVTAHAAIISTTTETAGGGFSGTNNVRLFRVGKMVTMQCGVLSHSSAFGVNSAAAVIPVVYRPAIDLEITYQSILSYSRQLKVNADGSFGVDYRDEYSNANKTATDTGTTIFVSWLTA